MWQQLFAQHRLAYPNCVPIFTDGSKSASSVGSAMVCGDLTFSRCLPVQFSIFSAELGAISRALGHVIICRLPRAIIYTHSLSSLQCLASFAISRHPYFHLAQKLLVRISDLGLTVHFCWVPSHCGILGNEAADAAAADACHDVVGDFPIPAADHCSAIRRALLVSWQVLWSQEALNKLHCLPCSSFPSLLSLCHVMSGLFLLVFLSVILV